MYFNGNITYKNQTSSSFGLVVTEVPKINHSDIESESYEIPGRDGYLFGSNTYRSSAEIEVEFALYKPTNASGFSSASYQTAFRSIKTWLSGSGTLKLGDVSDSEYEVQKVEIKSSEREVVNYGKIKVIFTVYPLEFKSSSSIDGTVIGASTSRSITLETDSACPIYKFTCSETTGSITVNGHTIGLYQASNVYIDTRRQIAYYNSSSSAENKVNGDYLGLTLKNGANTITTSAGVTLTIYKSREGWVI